MRALSLLLILSTACRSKDLAVTDSGLIPGDDSGQAVDADGDGVPEDEDCDDSDPSAFPGAEELCDGVDNNCDGAVDEGVQLTAYTDADGDGYGDDDSATSVCELSEGWAAQGGDCDDADPAYNPGATEDDCTDPNDYNCDGSVGYADQDADGFAACEDCDDSDGDTFPGAAPNDDAAACMTDADADDWGDDSPGSGVTAGTDCDDSAATSYPGASDTWYDGVDSDCAGDNDYDADLDGFDSDAHGGTDCDDAQASVYPGADEDGGSGSRTGDGLDNDCDGHQDEGLLYGSGADGALSVTNDDSLDSHGGGCAEVSSLGSDTATVSDASAFTAGDKALLINLQGDGSGSSHLGAWEIFDVAGVSGSTLTFVEALANTYGETSNADLSGQQVALLRVPQFTTVTVASGVTLTAGSWDGACGGVLAFTATGAVSVDGALSGDAMGYAGGIQNNSHDNTGEQGESFQGAGVQANTRNLGGGGGGGMAGASCPNCEGTGGGGSHGEDGEQGEQSNPSIGDGGEGGVAYGDSSFAALTLGSGGGAGALDAPSEQGIGGAGGAGGGAVLVYATSVDVVGEVSARGEDGEIGCAEFSNWCGTASTNQPSEAEPGGAGAGGAIYLISETLTVTGSLDATGGDGQLSGSSWQRVSGDGGDGIIRLDFTTLNGQSAGTTAAETEAGAVCEPTPGTLGTP